MAAAKPKRMTKAQVIADISERTELSKKEINGVFEALRDVVKRELGRRGPGEFVIPEVALKLRLVKKPARKNAKFRNPQTGEVVIKDVPASKKVRATPLKKLKELVL
ncbi:MAG: HU family DNA-binding protein [Myxococcota bacterium]